MLTFPAKKLRAEVIARYCKEAGCRGVVCFSCGNASQALKDVGLYVVDISPTGDMEARRWWTMAEIHKAWPDLLDATSGHLPVSLMNQIAESFEAYLGDLPNEVEVPTGSGETLVCLRLAYPGHRFVPVRNINKATTYHPEAPLNKLVEALT
jgi:hypothetical protein